MVELNFIAIYCGSDFYPFICEWYQLCYKESETGSTKKSEEENKFHLQGIGGGMNPAT